MHFTRKSLIVPFGATLLVASSIVCADAPISVEPLSAADLLAFYEMQSATPPTTEAAVPAADSAPTADGTRSAGDFNLTFSPALWMARVRGNTSWNGPNFTIDDQLGQSEYEATLSGELAASWGVFYKVMLTGWFFSTDGTTSATTGGAYGSVAISVGDQLSNSYSAAGAGGEFDVTLWQPFADQKTPWGPTIVNTRNTAPDGGYKADLRIKAIGAVRWYSASISVNDQTTGVSDSWSMDAVMPGIGGGLELDFNFKGRVPLVEMIKIEASSGTGTNFVNGQYFTFIRAGITAMFTPNVGVQFGYRLEDFKLVNDAANFDGGVQGLFLGANVKF